MTFSPPFSGASGPLSTTKIRPAEYCLNRGLEALQKKGAIEDLLWPDKKGEPDFTFNLHGKLLRLECKHIP
jgi:hypothetical protein